MITMFSPHQLLEKGQQYLKAGQLKQAWDIYQQVLQQRPNHPQAIHMLGVILYESRAYQQAIALLEKALALQPNDPYVHNNLGNTLRYCGEPERAIGHFQKAMNLKPDFAVAHNNLAATYCSMEKYEKAEQFSRQALKIQDNYSQAHYNLALALQRQGKLKEAIDGYRQCLIENPQLLEAYNNLGGMLWELGSYELAQHTYEAALEINPNATDIRKNLAALLGHIGYPEEARSHYQKLMEIQPSDALRLRMALLLPPIYESIEELVFWRKQMIQELKHLEKQPLNIPEPYQSVYTVNFYAAYHGQEDKSLQEILTRIYQKSSPDLAYIAPHCTQKSKPQGKIKIGFISNHFWQHTIGMLNKGLIANLDRDCFEVQLFFLTPPLDNVGHEIWESANQSHLLSKDFKQVRNTIASQELDILFYPDIGMESFTYFLAYARLAPVQCMTWGHPVTSGIPTIDYFFSSRDLEAPEAEQQYTEKLILMDQLLPYYEMPQPPPLKSREEMGLGQDWHIYICPQSLFKFHPDFDSILADILNQDPQGYLVLLEGFHSHWQEILSTRFSKQLPMERVIFLPRQKKPDFINLLAIADVMLDPLHFGGGNTAYEALAVNLPIVTWPSPFMKSRIVFAMYQKMGVTDWIADSAASYVKIACQLGIHNTQRQIAKGKIQARKHVLYKNMQAVREFEQTLCQITESG